MADIANVLAAASHSQSPALTNSDGSSSDLVRSTPRSQPKNDMDPRDRDSGVFLSDSEDLLPPPVPKPASNASSFSLNHIQSTKSPSIPQRTTSTTRRLQRPAELNLGANPGTFDDSKPKSELEMRFDFIRNSQSKSKAALKSPTQLLQDRLNLSPKKSKFQEKVRIFTPPQPMLNGCILPGPAAQMQAFQGSSVRARTQRAGRPAWWCKFDKVVVFDGVDTTESGEQILKTRTSKGLTIARRRGDTETVVIPLDCSHCQDMLNRHEWKYDVQVCKRVVCWDCRERCRWELEQERPEAADESVTDEQMKTDGNRIRADSVLQDEQVGENELREQIGIESEPKGPVAFGLAASEVAENPARSE